MTSRFEDIGEDGAELADYSIKDAFGRLTACKISPMWKAHSSKPRTSIGATAVHLADYLYVDQIRLASYCEQVPVRYDKVPKLVGKLALGNSILKLHVAKQSFEFPIPALGLQLP